MLYLSLSVAIDATAFKDGQTMAKATSRVVAFDGEIKTFDGNPISPALTYSGKVKQYAADAPGVIEAMKAAGDYPKEEDLITFANARLKAKSRAKVIAAALEEAGYSKPEAGSNESFYRNMVKTLTDAGKSDEQAALLAEQVLGYNLAQAKEKDAEKKAAEEQEAETADVAS